MDNENNRLIAEFMGWTLASPPDIYTNPDDQDDCWEVGEMMFRSSWNWLMPVIAEIRRMQHGMNEKDNDKYEELFDLDFFFDMIMEANIEEVYAIVVAFIKYIQNKK